MIQQYTPTHITICGGGSLGHVIAGYLAYHTDMKVSVLTRNPEKWNNEIKIIAPDESYSGKIECVTTDPSKVIPNADIVLLTVPGNANFEVLSSIKPYLNSSTFIGGVFCSSGFFFEAKKIIPSSIPLWGFQRVPFISRVKEYGKSAYLKGYKSSLNIAVENCDNSLKESFREFIERIFGIPVYLLNNYLEASISNSNPILHTSRLYTLFSNWQPDIVFTSNIPFYESWNNEASELLIKMDEELFQLIHKLPVDPGFLKPILDYYESKDADSLTKKISSISSFKGIMSPMKETKNGLIPDFSSRYFVEDFGYGLKYIIELLDKYDIEAPSIRKVYQWGKVMKENFSETF